MDFAICSLVLLVLALVAYYFVSFYTFWWRRGIPCPKGLWPIVGHILPVLTLQYSLSEFSRKVYNTYKNSSMIGVLAMGTPTLIIREPGLVRTVMQTNFVQFHENVANIDSTLDPLLSTNPFFTYGEAWQTGRKRLAYAFSSMRLKILFQSVLGVTKKFEAYLKRKLHGSDKVEVELKELFSRFTAEVVVNAGFGLEGSSFDDNPGPATFYTMGQEFFTPSAQNGLMQALVFFFPKLQKFLRTSWIPKKIDQFFRGITYDVLARRRSEPVRRNDFFQLMMDLEKAEGEKIDPDVIASHAFSFFADGYETSSTTLSFMAYQLARHPEVQEKLRKEVIAVLEKYDGDLTYDGLKEMTYMDQVLSESQRLIPAVGALSKVCTEEFELKGSDGLSCKMQPGMRVIISVHGMQTDPNYWKDPEKFDPERFGDERKKEIEKCTFLPFGEGPRFCVGMRMAVVQMKSALATLLKDYSLELSPRTKLPIKLRSNHILSAAEGGLWAYVKPL